MNLKNKQPCKRLISMDVLKAVACLLIINSHCRALYPIEFLALGGGQGNVIFLLVSGYLGARFDKNVTFIQWYQHKIKRIVPTAILFVIASFLFWDARSESLFQKDLITILKFYLDKYWFIWAICIYYIPYYFAYHNQKSENSVLVITGVIGLYLFLYFTSVNQPFLFVEKSGFAVVKVVNYLIPMLFGGLISLHFKKGIAVRDSTKLSGNCRSHQIIFVFGMVVGLSMWGIEYLLITLFDTGLQAQFLINIGNWIFGVCLLYLVVIRETKWTRTKFFNNRVIMLLSASTLEIYLLQISIQRFFQDLFFPLNIILFFAVSVVGGVIIHQVFSLLYRKNHCRTGQIA